MAGRTIPAPRRMATPKRATTINRVNLDSGISLQDEMIVANTAANPVELALPPIGLAPLGFRVVVYQEVFTPGNALTVLPDAADRIMDDPLGVAIDMTAEQMLAVEFVSDGVGSWLADSLVGPLPQVIFQQQILIGILRSVVLNPFGGEIASVRPCEALAVDGIGDQAAEQLVVDVDIFDDALFAVPSVNGTVSVGVRGAALAGNGSSSAVMQYDAAGELDLDVEDLVGGATHWMRVSFQHRSEANSNLILQGNAWRTAAWA